ncbi:MAG: hypothetical protein RI918_1117 [Pseudomonadota bacterium]|jgi:hypothetical protein
MTKEQSLMLTLPFLMLILGYLVYKINQSSKAPPRRLKNRSSNSSSASGADGAAASMSMASADCGSSVDGGCGGGD